VLYIKILEGNKKCIKVKLIVGAFILRIKLAT
jgi:hypothetical protein